MRSLKNSIYYPNALEASSFSDLKIANKSQFSFNNENIKYKATLYTSIHKTIELAICFDMVYLDFIEYIFIVSQIIDLYFDQPFILELIEKKISYINGDQFFLTNIKHSENLRKMSLFSKPIEDSEKIKQEIISKTHHPIDYKIIENSIANRLNVKKVEGKHLTKICRKEMVNNFFERFSINETFGLNFTEENKELYDLILLTFKNNYLCNLYGINSIYHNEYEFGLDKIKYSFSNRVGYTSCIFDNVELINITSLIAEEKMNELHQIIKSVRPLLFEEGKSVNNIASNLKKYSRIIFNCYDSLKFSYSSTLIEDYKGRSLRLIKDNKIENINYLSFDDYLKSLENSGVLLKSSRLFIKIIEKKYLDDFFYKGKIKFSKPVTWVKNAATSIGKGDPFEGIITGIKPSTTEEKERRDNVLNKTLGWCCFGLNNTSFNAVVTINGKKTRAAVISKDYFKDFKIGDSKYSVVLIKPDIFVRKFLDFIKNKTDFNLDKIHISPMTYITKSTSSLKVEYPLELFYKSIRFSHQKEVRIILEDDGSDFYNKIATENTDGIFEIGDLSDCVQELQCFPDKNLLFAMRGENKAIILECDDDFSFDKEITINDGN